MIRGESILYREAWHPVGTRIRVGQRFLICPRGDRHGASPGDLVIELDMTPVDPAMGVVFGTGAHPSTQLALALLEDRVRAGDRVLDVGTGSGILALAAARLGAREVLALDIDAEATATARAHAALNGLADIIHVCEGSLEAAAVVPFDVAVANILAPVIERFAPGLAARLRPQGLLIVSGVTASQSARLAATLGAAGFQVEEERAQDDWRGLTLRCQS